MDLKGKSTGSNNPRENDMTTSDADVVANDPSGSPAGHNGPDPTDPNYKPNIKTNANFTLFIQNLQFKLLQQKVVFFIGGILALVLFFCAWGFAESGISYVKVHSESLLKSIDVIVEDKKEKTVSISDNQVKLIAESISKLYTITITFFIAIVGIFAGIALTISIALIRNSNSKDTSDSSDTSLQVPAQQIFIELFEAIKKAFGRN